MVRMKILFLDLLLLVIHCDKDSPTNPSADHDSYTPLHSGDVTQLISVRDSSTVLLEIGGQVKRSDGLTVFEQLLTSGTDPADTSYTYTDGEFLIDTNLEPVNQNSELISVNPFQEQRLAKSFPHENDTWSHTVGDSDSMVFVARKEEKIHTLWDDIEGFAFDLYDSTGVRMMSIYYAKRLGWIGTATSQFRTDLYICSYKKIGSKEWGELRPAKNADGWVLAKKGQNIKCDLTSRIRRH
jgi:hypothetical protein